MRLDDLPPVYAGRVGPAKDPTAWAPHVEDPRAAEWLAWNVREDAWYEAAELTKVQQTIDAAPDALTGPELLLHGVSALKQCRHLSPTERSHLPANGVNHVAAKFNRRYDFAPESAWAEGSSPGEIAETVIPGDRFRLIPKGGLAWLTFEANGKPVPKEPEDIARQLGLCWGPSGGAILRVEVPLDALRSVGATMLLPTLFDTLDDRPGSLQHADWRARPEREHCPGEPWGNARDMQADGPALPEVIVNITQAGTMEAECVGTLISDWSTRPFLSRSAPR